MRIVLATEKPDFPGLFLPNHTGEITRTKAPIKTAHFRPHLTKDRIVGGDGQVAHDVQHMPPADGVTRNQGHDDFRHRSDEFLYFKHVESRYALTIDITTVTANRLIAASAESIFPVFSGTGPGKKNNPNRLIFARVQECCMHLHDRLRAEGIALLWSVNRDLGHTRGLLIDDVVVFFNYFPSGRHGRNVRETP